MALPDTCTVVSTYAGMATLPVDPTDVDKLVWIEGYWSGDATGCGWFTIRNAGSPPADDGGTVLNSTYAPGMYFTRNIGEPTAYEIEWFGGRPEVTASSPIATANVTAFNNAIVAAPVGGSVTWGSGAFQINAQLAWSKRVGFVCKTLADYVLVVIGNTTTDAIVFGGTLTNLIDFRINIAGTSGMCRDAIVITKLISPQQATFNVLCAAARYGLRLGGVENAPDIRYQSTVNFTDYPVQGVPQTAHVQLEDASPYGTNANKLSVDISGGVNGVNIVSNISDAGDITITGVIQGLSAAAIIASGGSHLTLKELHMESNGNSSIINDVSFLSMRDSHCPDGTFYLQSCKGYTIVNWRGGFNIDANCTGGSDDQGALGVETFVCVSRDHETRRSLILDSSAIVRHGGVGCTEVNSLATNGFITNWSGSVPSQFGGTNVTWAHLTANPNPENPNADYAQATVSGATIADGPDYLPGKTFRRDIWISFMISLNVTKATTLYVWVSSPAAQYISTGLQALPSTGDNGWNQLRGSVLIPAGATWKISPRALSAGAVINIGGIAWFWGSTAPKYLQ